MRQCPDQCCERGGEKLPRLLADLHLPMGEETSLGLFFVYCSVNFEVALAGYGRGKKRGNRGLSPAQSARRTAGRSACPADSRNRQNPYRDTVENGSTLGNFGIHDPQLDPKALKSTPIF